MKLLSGHFVHGIEEAAAETWSIPVTVATDDHIKVEEEGWRRLWGVGGPAAEATF